MISDLGVTPRCCQSRGYLAHSTSQSSTEKPSRDRTSLLTYKTPVTTSCSLVITVKSLKIQSLILTYVSFSNQIHQIPPFCNLSFVLEVAEGVRNTPHQFKAFNKSQTQL